MTVIPPSDDLLTLADIARRIPGARGARRLHPATITRWILKGAKATDGTVVRLRATRVGHRWLVRAAHLDEFFAALAPAAGAPPATPPVRTPAARQRASELANSMLKQVGA